MSLACEVFFHSWNNRTLKLCSARLVRILNRMKHCIADLMLFSLQLSLIRRSYWYDSAAAEPAQRLHLFGKESQ